MADTPEASAPVAGAAGEPDLRPLLRLLKLHRPDAEVHWWLADSLLPLLAPSLLSAISLIYWFGNQGVAKSLLQALGFESLSCLRPSLLDGGPRPEHRRGESLALRWNNKGLPDPPESNHRTRQASFR